MTTTLKKLSALILALGTLFILSFPSIAHAADTGGSDHFELTVVENKDSKSGAEVADLTIKNISNKTAQNVTFEADLPTIFHDQNMKKVTYQVGTLKAGESKTYQVSRKVTTNALPTTGNALPTTGDVTTSLFLIIGLLLLAGIVAIALKRFRGAKSLVAILILLAGLGGVATVNAAEKTYHHRDEVRNHAVELAGTTRVFHLAGEGDFEGEADNPGDKGGTGDKGDTGDKGKPDVSNSFTITYYINGDKVTDLDPDGYVSGVKTIDLPVPTFTNDNFSGWYDNEGCTGDVITSLAKETTGHKVFYGKTTPKAHQVTFDLKGGYFQDATAMTQEVEHGAKVTQPTEPVKDEVEDETSVTTFVFAGWLTEEDQDFSFDTLMTEDMTLHAKWDETHLAKVAVTFRNYDDTGDDVLPTEVVRSGATLSIPAAPDKANEYFLGWAEMPSAAKTETLYVPDADTAIQSQLNAPDQGYLGYAIKSENELQNITADKTLYAVYYKQLKATDAQGQDFIWNDAIWRVLNTDANSSTQRLVIKVSALTETEFTNLGFTLENIGLLNPEITSDGAVTVHFHSQSQQTSESKYFFKDAADTGYGRSRLKAVIDAYYHSLSDQSAVLPVNLNLPSWTTYTGTGYDGSKNSPTSWTWKYDAADGNNYKNYRDARFATTIGGDKQAFALSYGDIHGAIGVPTTAGNIHTMLLDFTGSNNIIFWLRSPGYHHLKASWVGGRSNLAHFSDVIWNIPVRPALYLSIDD